MKLKRTAIVNDCGRGILRDFGRTRDQHAITAHGSALSLGSPTVSEEAFGARQPRSVISGAISIRGRRIFVIGHVTRTRPAPSGASVSDPILGHRIFVLSPIHKVDDRQAEGCVQKEKEKEKDQPNAGLEPAAL